MRWSLFLYLAIFLAIKTFVNAADGEIVGDYEVEEIRYDQSEESENSPFVPDDYEEESAPQEVETFEEQAQEVETFEEQAQEEEVEVVEEAYEEPAVIDEDFKAEEIQTEEIAAVSETKPLRTMTVVKILMLPINLLNAAVAKVVGFFAGVANYISNIFGLSSPTAA